MQIQSLAATPRHRWTAPLRAQPERPREEPVDSVALSSNDVTSLQEESDPLELYDVMARANAEDDPALLDSIDRFRQSLPPELQEEYDRRLEELRNDPRIQFSYRDGEPNPAAEDLMLRGILAVTFGRPELLDLALEQNDDGVLNIEITHTWDTNPNNEGRENGTKFGGGDIAISIPGMLKRLSQGLDVTAHEFLHAIQDRDGVPTDVDQEWEDEFYELYADAYGEDAHPDSHHHFVYASWDFFYFPEELKQRSPELYAMLADYFEFDPLAEDGQDVGRLPPPAPSGSGRPQRKGADSSEAERSIAAVFPAA